MLLVNCFTSLVAESSRGLVLSSLYSYLIYLAGKDDGIKYVGLCVALFSAGRLASSYMLAAMVDHGGVAYKTILLYCFILQIIGYLLYLIPENLGPGVASPMLVALARLIIGFGSGTLPTTRSVVVDLTEVNERTFEFSLLSFARYAGYALTPGLGALFIMDWQIGIFEINAFTAPAWISIIMNTVAFFLVIATFDPALGGFDLIEKLEKERPKTIVRQLADEDSDNELISEQVVETKKSFCYSLRSEDPVYNFFTYPLRATYIFYLSMKGMLLEWYGGIHVCIFPKEKTDFDISREGKMLQLALHVFIALNFVTKGVLAISETSIAAEFASTFGPGGDPGGQQALVNDTSIFTLELGLIGLLGYGIMVLKPKQGKSMLEPEEPDEDVLEEESVNEAAARSEEEAGLVVDSEERETTSKKKRPIRCWRRFRRRIDEWYDFARCHANEIDVWLILFSLVLGIAGDIVDIPNYNVSPPIDRATLFGGTTLVWSLSAPIVDVLAVSCYSVLVTKVLGKGSQATQMGYISAAGSLGRIAFPFLIDALSLSWSLIISSITAGLCFVGTVLLYALYPDALERPHSFEPLSKLACLRESRKEVDAVREKNLEEYELPTTALLTRDEKIEAADTLSEHLQTPENK
jgi:Major Facilitator Superfamily